MLSEEVINAGLLFPVVCDAITAAASVVNFLVVGSRSLTFSVVEVVTGKGISGVSICDDGTVDGPDLVGSLTATLLSRGGAVKLP